MVLFLFFLTYLGFYYKNLNYNLVIFFVIFFSIYFGFVYLYLHKAKKINKEDVKEKIRKFEIRNNIISFIIYEIILIALFLMYQKGIITFSMNFSSFVVFEAILLVFIHDIYFYVLHRTIHIPILYKRIHKDHHLSVNSSVWSAYNFSIIEAIAYTIPLFVIILLNIYFEFMINLGALLFAVFINDFANFIGHSGYEIFNLTKLKKYKLFSFLVVTSYHDLHHTRNQGNFGLYFSYLDKILGTYDKTYDDLLK